MLPSFFRLFPKKRTTTWSLYKDAPGKSIVPYAEQVFDVSQIAYFGVLKRWNGSSWVKAKMKTWNGIQFVEKPMKYFDGVEFRLVNTSGN